MYKIIRLFNQNRKKIFIIIIIIVLVLVLIQLLNSIAKIQMENEDTNTSNKRQNTMLRDELVSDKSLVSGEYIASVNLQRDTNVIDAFFSYCNQGNINEAYELLTDECKEEMFPSIEDFENIYVSNIFNGQKSNYTVENWVDNIYQVRISGDILSTGNLDNSQTKQDYITVVHKTSGDKLNINNYVGRTIINKETENNNIKVIINSVDTYMDYEIYDVTVENNSSNRIALDSGNDTKSVYLMDSNNIKYYFYSNEIIENTLIVKSKFNTNLKIKFGNSHNSTRTIESLVFSKMILNYDEYLKLEDKTQFTNYYEFIAEI